MLYQTKNPHGGDIYGDKIRLDYSANTNPYGTPPAVLEAVREVLGNIHQYPDPYCRKLAEAIAEHEQVPQSYILCGNGAAELIYAYCQALRPRLASEAAPTFAEYSLALEKNGCRIVRFLLREENHFLLDDRFLAFLEDTKPDVLFLCNPNNPTGQLIPEALLHKLLRLCRKTGMHLFLDECFLDMTGQNQSLVPLLGQYPELLILKAFTKSYGMAGLRLGYCLSSNSALLQTMSESCQPWNVSTPAQAAGVAALGQQDFLTKTVQTVIQERAWLTEQLIRCGFRVCPGSANYLLFHGPEGLDTVLRQQGIAIRSCANYHGLDAGWYRIAVRLHEQNEMLMDAICQVCGGK